MSPYLHNGLNTLKRAGRLWLDSNAGSYAGSLAFFTLFSLAPVIILAVKVISLVTPERRLRICTSQHRWTGALRSRSMSPRALNPRRGSRMPERSPISRAPRRWAWRVARVWLLSTHLPSVWRCMPERFGPGRLASGVAWMVVVAS